MDFSWSEEASAVAELAQTVLEEGAANPEAVCCDGMDTALWSTLAESELLGACLPETVGGAGMGALAWVALLEQAGRCAAPVPLMATLVLGAWPVVMHGRSDQQARFLAGVASGERVLTGAYSDAWSADPFRPATLALARGGEFVLQGVRTNVPYLNQAQFAVVPARLPDESAGLFLVDLGAAGVVRETQQGTSIAPLGVLELNDVRVTAEDACLPQASGPEQLIRTAVHAAQLAQCACMLGAAQKAVELTAAYVSTREQFGRPIGTFQAVSQRAADMYIDVATLRVAVLQAAWRMAEGLPVDRELAIAGYWAAEAGHRIQAAAMHLHGGMGFDCDYELHRYYLLSRQMEMTLGGASAHLKTLGDWMAQAYSEVARDASRDKTA